LSLVALAKIALFWFCEGLACVLGKTKCVQCGWQKEILKNGKGWLFLFSLSLVSIAKHGQFESLAARSILSECRVHF